MCFKGNCKLDRICELLQPGGLSTLTLVHCKSIIGTGGINVCNLCKQMWSDVLIILKKESPQSVIFLYKRILFRGQLNMKLAMLMANFMIILTRTQ